MAVTNKMYGNAVKNLFNNTINVGATDVIKVALFSAYTFNEDHETWAHVIASGSAGPTIGNGTEATCTAYTPAYTAYGENLAWTVATRLAYSGGITTFDADDVEWADSTIDAAYAIVYKNDTTDADRLLICCIDFGATESSVDGTFKIEWHADGIFKADVSPA